MLFPYSAVNSESVYTYNSACSYNQLKTSIQLRKITLLGYDTIVS